VAVVGSARGREKKYSTRRPMRALLLAVVLGTVAGLTWLSVLHQTGNGCSGANPAAAARGGASERLPHDGLDAVSPAPPQLVRVQVLNANGVRGEATVVDSELAHMGFAPTTTPANDPLYPSANMHCYGEIRFGPAGQAAARTLSLAVPCADLVRDSRPDSVIDFALGTKFLAVRPNDAALTALLDLAGVGQSVSVGPSHGGLAAQTEPQPAVPVVNPDLFRRARHVQC
jgi:hypothetical protein